MRKTTFLMKCALVLLASCFFALDSSYAQGTYCGNAVTTSLNSNWQSLCADQFGVNPRHYRYVPSANGNLEICGTIAVVSRGCVNGTATNTDNGTVVGSCFRGNIKRFSLFAGQPIYIKVVAGTQGSCVDAKVVTTSSTGISQLCNEGTELNCGQTISGDNYSGGNDFQTSDYSCYGGSSNFSGNDVVYKVSVPAGQNEVQFNLQPLQKDVDLFIYRCINGTPICITRSLNSGTSAERIRITNAQNKTYYAVVDGFDANQQSTFTFEVSGCGTTQPTFPCDGIPIGCGETVSSSNFNTGNDSDIDNYRSCFTGNASFPGNDEIYKLNVPNPTNINVTLSGLSSDLDLFILQCDGNGNATCVARSVNGNNANDAVTINNASGEYFIVVDAQFETSNSNFNLSVQGDECVGETNDDCDGVDFDYVSALRYEFSIGDGYPFGNWIVRGGPFTDPLGTAIGSGASTTYTFPQAGVYDVCYKYVENGAIKECCKTVEVVANPYDCNDIFYAFNSETNRYEFNIPGITDAQVVRWQDDDNGSTIGTGSVATVPVGPSCEVRNFSVIFFDAAVGYYRVCCISMFVCDPYDCDAITYGYDVASSSYVLSIPNITEASWYDDDNGTALGTGTSVNVAPDNNCRVRNFSVRFFDPGVNAYRICCISLYVCDPYNCDSIEKVYNPDNNTWALSLPGVGDSDVIRWQNDATGQSVGNESSTVVNNTAAGTCAPYSVLFFDAATQSYRVCCLEICLDDDGCIGTPSDNECAGPGVVEDTPVCGCDGNAYDSTCDALAAGVQSWTEGACTGETDPDCDALSYDYVSPLRYEFSVAGLAEGSWAVTGGRYTEPNPIGTGTSTTFTFPEAGIYEVCYLYVEDGSFNGTLLQCCKTIEISRDPYDCNEIKFDYNPNTRAYDLVLPGVDDADVLRWQDDNSGETIGTSSTVSVSSRGECGIRNFSVLFYDAAVQYYRVCCISIYVCDPYDCNSIEKVYNPDNNTWALSLPGITDADVLYWRNDATGEQLEKEANTANVPNPSAGTCTPYSVLFFDAATQSYRVCCIEICLNEDGCIGTPSDNECSDPGVVEEVPVCGCDNRTYDSACAALAAGVQSWTEGQCTGDTDTDCDGITFEFFNTLRYTFTIDASYPFGNWLVTGGPFTDPLGTAIGSGASTTYTFPEEGTYQVCYKYVEDGLIKQCCRTIEVVSDPYNCDLIQYAYDSDERGYVLSIDNVSVLQWRDDDSKEVLGQASSVVIPVTGTCGNRNFSVIYYDTAIQGYGTCCISIYICDPYDCDNIEKVYNPDNNTWALTLPGVNDADILRWQNDASGQQIASGTNSTTVNNPVAGTCAPYSVLFFDTATDSYRVCCLELCLNDDGCTGTPSDTECSGPGVVEEVAVCGCDGNTYDSACEALAAGVQSWEDGPCTGDTDPDCDALSFDYVSPLRYEFSVAGLATGSWAATGGPYATPTGIGTGTSTTHTFPQAGVYEICYLYVEDGSFDGTLVQCCKTIEISADPYDCNDITFNYNTNTRAYDLNIPGIANADVIRWQDDNTGQNLGTASTVSVSARGDCGVRNFSVLFFDAAVNAYRVCCISIYICDPYDCNNIEKVYNPDNNTWALSLPGISDSEVLYWRNDANGQQIASSTTSTTVNNPAAGSCTPYSVLFYDAAVDAYRVCCLELCLNADGCTGTPSDTECSGPGVVEEVAVCGCDGNQYDSACDALAAGVQSWTDGPCGPPPCGVVSNATLTCKDDGSVDYSFTLTNNSGQLVDAEFTMLSPIGVTFGNCSLVETVTNVGGSRNISLNIDNCLVSIASGDQVTYKIVLREAGKAEGWCCHIDPITLTMPDCGNTSTPTCNDGIQNQGETGVDCGGPCAACPPSCTDGIQNGDETGVDCGGSCPNACPATCDDGIQNGDETGVDCGGSNCPDCPQTDCNASNQLNLVRNGDFEGGNWAFTTDYADGCWCRENSYCVQTNAQNKCNTWNNVTGTGKFLMVDAGRNSPDLVWAQDVTVQAGVEYTFCFDMYRNLSNGSSPVIRMWVDDDRLGGAAPGQNNRWVTYSRTWTAQTSGTVSLSLQLVSAAGGSDDFGIDNIGMKYCPSNVAPETDAVLTTKTSGDVALTAAPNPFTNATTISFTLSSDMPATVSVFNMNGKRVFTRTADFVEGVNTVDFEADASLSAGIYYYRLETAEQSLTKSMILMRQ